MEKKRKSRGIYLFIYLFMFNVYMRPCGYDRRPVTILAVVRSPKHKHTRRITNKQVVKPVGIDIRPDNRQYDPI